MLRPKHRVPIPLDTTLFIMKHFGIICAGCLGPGAVMEFWDLQGFPVGSKSRA